MGNRYRRSPTNSAGGARFLVVAIDYFTKWVKAKPLISMAGRHMEKFVWEHIVCKFRRPQIIISDNGKQFAEGTFPVLCKKLGTLQAFTSVYHPQANGQVEVTNKEIVKGMERRLGMAHHGLCRWELHKSYGPYEATPNSRVQGPSIPRKMKNDTRDLDVLEEEGKSAHIRRHTYNTKIRRLLQQDVKAIRIQAKNICARLKSAVGSTIKENGTTWEDITVCKEKATKMGL
ncbi:reverse transcriptase domain-containing protein [Tanacetum coccineum]